MRTVTIPGPGLALLLPLALAACAGDGTGTTPTPSTAGATWYGDVAALSQRSCQECHTAGGPAPFDLDSYEAARAWGPALVDAVERRTMPPYYAVGDGSCQTFADNHWLSDEEIATFTAWGAAGYPEGDPADGPGPFTPPPGLGEDALSYAMPAAYAPVVSGNPGDPKDDYRCFLVSEGRDRDLYVTGFEALPGNATIVHHLLAYTLDPDQEVTDTATGTTRTNEAIIADLIAEDPTRGGWPCYGTAGEGTEVNGLVGSWAPGTGALIVPEGTGVSMRGQDWVIIQVHYNLDNGAGTDQTTVRFGVAEAVDEEAYVVLPDGLLATLDDEEPFVIDPGQASVDFTWTGQVSELSDYLAEHYPERFPVPPTAFDVYGAFPHMHALGESLTASLTTVSTGASECLLDMPRWDFNWQHLYLYEAPLRFTQDHEVRVTCTWDSRSRITPTFPGPNTEDEMCLLGLYFTVP